MMQQSEVDKVLNSVAAYQSEMSSGLTNLEGLIDRAFANQASNPPQDADIQRERAYQQVIDVDHRLRSIVGSLDSIVADLNASGEVEEREGSVGQIVKILNAHHETLAWLEGQARGIELNLAESKK